MAKDYASNSYKKKRKKTPLKARSDKGLKKTSKNKPTKKKAPLKKKSAPKKKAAAKRQSTVRQKQQSGFPIKRSVLFVVFIVIVVIAFLYLRHQYRLSHPQALEQTSAKVARTLAAQDVAQQVKQAPMPKINFVFKADEPAPVTPSSIYMLQLGTFDPNSPDLQVLQSQLSKLHLRYETLTFHRDQQLRVRVQMGPYKGQDAAEAAWQALYQQKIYAVMRELD